VTNQELTEPGVTHTNVRPISRVLLTSCVIYTKMTDKNSFDLDRVGLVPYCQENTAEKAYRLCQQHKRLSICHFLLVTICYVFCL
jgi:hypothetical protein